MYDAAVGRFFTQDRFAEKYFSSTPYHYVLNNPLIFIDLNGDSTVYISGKGANVATNALNSTTSNLEITRDSNTDALSYKGTAVTPYEKELAAAIDDQNIIVNIKIQEKVALSPIKDGIVLGGAFGGSEIKDDGNVIATQYLNMESANQYAEVSGGDTSGDVVGHELLEAYVAAKDNPGAKMDEYGKYYSAHSKAKALLPQRVVRAEYNENGFQFVPGKINAFKVDNNKPKEIFKPKKQ